MSKNHVVKYPRTIKDFCGIAGDMKETCSILKKSNLPDDALLFSTACEGLTTVSIIVTDGRIFSGVAIKKPGDKDDLHAATLIAMGRALATAEFALEGDALMEQAKQALVRQNYIIHELSLGGHDAFCK